MLRAIALLTLAFFMISSPAVADEYDAAYQTLTEMNRIQPLQNPQYEKDSKVLARRLIDRKNKVMGDVHDILVDKDGVVTSLNVDFNRLQHRDTVFLNYRKLKIRPAQNGFITNFNSDDVASLYPSFVADVESAAGGEDVYSVKNLKGISVTAEDGRNLGTVDNILFGAEGERVEAVNVSLKTGILHGQTVAVPFKSVSVQNKMFGGQKAVIPNELADAVLNYAESEK